MFLEKYSIYTQNEKSERRKAEYKEILNVVKLMENQPDLEVVAKKQSNKK